VGFKSRGQASVRARNTAARRLRVALLAGTALTFVAPPALAQVAQNWNGSVSTDWFDGNNWDSTTPPATGDSVTIDTITPNPTVMSGGTALGLDGLNVGFTGTGMLTVNTGAAVTVTNNVVIGGDLGGTFTSAIGTMVLDNSTLAVTGTPPGTGTIFVGASGTGSFTAQNGSTVTTVDSYVGHLLGATGTATVNGSTWANSSDNFVGNQGTGVFNVLNGGAVTVGRNTIVGADTMGNGTINISGVGSSWTTTGLTILGGNALTPAGGSGTINVSNGGTYTANDDMHVGLVGTGAINVTAGGQLTSASNVYLGFTSGATGTVTISGAGSTWTANGGVTVVGGNDGSVPVGGNGIINVLNGAIFDTTARDVVLGNDDSQTSNGTVNVSGATWNAGGIFVGESGIGTLNITNGATVTADLLIAGDCFCSVGTVNVSGGSTFTVATDVYLGFDGVGTMNVSGTGTSVTMQDLYLGLTAGATGTLNVSGPASVTARDLLVGFGGMGTVNVQNGASLTATGNVTIGVTGGANGTVNVSGAGSTLTVNDSVVIGNGGVGTGALNVFDGGTVNVTNIVFNADRVFVGAGSVISGGSYTADSLAATSFGLRSSSSGQINLGGTASLAGALVITGHNSVRTTYTLLTSTGLGGSTFDSVTYTAPLRNPVLVYTVGGNVLLTVDAFQLAASLPENANRNQRAVAQSMDNVVAGGTVLPPGLDYVFNLSGDALLSALTQLSGEIGAAPMQAIFNASNQFMNLLSGQGGGAAPGGFTAPGYAPEKKVDKRTAEAYAAVTPRDARAPRYDLFMPRWNAWAAGYGGNATVKGDAPTGSNDTTSRVYGMAAGADYRFSPDTVAGFALGGSGVSFNVLGGSGRGDVFQAGVYGRHHMGPAYVSAVLAYGWQHITTDRTLTVLGTDRLEANLNAQTLSARLEGGYHFATVWARVTPYAALQSTSFFLLSYSETAVSGSNQFALSYGSQTETNVRTELGLRADRSFATARGLLNFYGRAAWAHDTNTDRPANATFQALPGATFTVNGAKPAADGALVTVGAEMKWTNGWSVAGVFEGEFSPTTESYAGKGSVRYAW
jgi:T5SS/PEP-CTERM-associated repeat protein